MSSLKEGLSIERSRLFVGRHKEIDYMQQWLEQQEAPSEVVFLSGMGGIGKSSLLLKFFNMAQNDKLLCIWLDGRTCTETPTAFLESLHSYLNLVSAAKSSLTEVAGSLSRQRTFLCIDNYDRLQQIGGWLREVFLPELSATGLLVVLAGRQNLATEWQNDLAWKNRVTLMRLAPLSRVEAKTFYSNMGLDPNSPLDPQSPGSHGLPLAMALYAERSKRPLNGPEQGWPISHLISTVLLREIQAPDLNEILEVLCLLPQASVSLLNRLLGTPLTNHQLYQLSQLSFVLPLSGGIALHDAARVHLMEDFMQRDPKRYKALRLKIIEDAKRELKHAEPVKKRKIAANLLFLCRDSFVINAKPIIATDPLSVFMCSFHRGDLPCLHRLIQQRRVVVPVRDMHKNHELLNVVAERFPESIRVFRTEDGIPLGFFLGLRLYKETAACLESVIPLLLETCFPVEINRFKRLEFEAADTCLLMMAGCTSLDSLFTQEELIGYLAVDALSLFSAMDLRCVIVTSLFEVREFMEMGFRVKPLDVLPEAHTSFGTTMYELDFRNSNLGEYLAGLLQTSEMSNPETTGKLTQEDIMSALPLAGNPNLLGQTELAQKLTGSGTHLQQSLRLILNSDPPSYPLNKRKQSLLRLMCEEPDLLIYLAAARLYISRPTYYRDRREAIHDLIQLLSPTFET